MPIEYDPMLSKLVAYAPTRQAAIARMQRALEEYVIGGIRTNLQLFRRILRDSNFRAARIDTGYLDRLLAIPEDLTASAQAGAAREDVAAIAAALFEMTKRDGAKASPDDSAAASHWKWLARREGLR